MSGKRTTKRLKYILDEEQRVLDEGAKKAIERYTTLVTLDALACTQLFAEDATYRCSRGEESIVLTGHDAICEQLGRTPEGVRFKVSFFRQDGNGAMAELAIEGLEFGLVVETVLFTMEEDLIKSFEILQWE